MSQSIQNKKNSELLHLADAVQTHKQQFLRRPLSLAHAQLFLNSAAYLAQLIPAFFSHYHLILKQEEVSTLANDLMLLNEDLIAKLKATAEKLQAKNVDPARFYPKLSLPTLLSQNQQGDTFTAQQDKRFYEELREALQRKEEVLAICHSQSLQYAVFLQEQVQDLLTLKQAFFQKEEKEGETTDGEELKRDVSKSLQEQWRQKIPGLTKAISHKILRQVQQNRRLNSQDAQIQTEDTQDPKITEFKRKIGQLEKIISDQKLEKERLVTDSQQKELLVQKLQAELDQSREEFNRKQYDMQKSIRNLEQSTRKIKEEFSKEKSRKVASQRETGEQPKSIKLLQQLPEPENRVEKAQEEAVQGERAPKNKKTLIPSGGSIKFILPTLAKASSKDNYYSKTENSEANLLSLTSRTEKVNQTAREEFHDQTLAKKLKEKTILQVNHNKALNQAKIQKQNVANELNGLRLKKQNGKYPKLNRNKNTTKNTKIAKKDESQQQTKSPSRKKEISNSKKKEEILFPSINKEQPNRAAVINKINQTVSVESPENNKLDDLRLSTNQPANLQHTNSEQLIQQVPSNLTLKQIASHLDSKRAKYKVGQPEKMLIKVEPVFKRAKTNEQIRQACINLPKKSHISFEAVQSLTDRINSLGDIKKEDKHSKMLWEAETGCKKTYILSTPFQEINQETEKENYTTPLLGVESPGLALQTEIVQKSAISLNSDKFVASLKYYLNRVLQALRKEEYKSIDLKNLKTILEQWQKKEEIRSKNEKNGNQRAFQRLNLINFEIQNSKANEILTLKNQNYGGLHKKVPKMLTEGQDSINPTLRHPHTQMYTPHSRDPFAKERGSFPISQKKPDLANNSIDAGFSPQYAQGLFLSKQMALKYESGFAKKLGKRSRKTGEEVERAGDQLYMVLQQLKGVDKGKYEKICRELRYPFSSCKINNLQIEVVNSMSVMVIRQCLQMVAMLHQKCRGQAAVCPHIADFTRRLELGLQTSSQNYC